MAIIIGAVRFWLCAVVRGDVAVYLREFEVINKANAGMRSFYQLAKWFTILAMIGYVVAFFNAPVHQRYR